jgi:hypothetical protein
MEFKTIDGYAGKYEIGEDGTVRNVKTKRETKPYHSSELTGPMVHLLNAKTSEEGRLPVVKMVKDLFGQVPAGWENVNVDTLEYKPVIRRSARLAQKEADEKAVEAANEIVEEMEQEQLEAEYAEVDAEAILADVE